MSLNAMASAALALLLIAAPAGAAEKGLLALYTFEEPDGSIVRDRSGHGEPLDLEIANPSHVRRSPQGLEITRATVIRSAAPARKITEVISRRREISVELWARPANLKQDGPARIITISKDSSARNFTLGQEGDRIAARFRTSSTDENGLPAVETRGKSLTGEWTHIVYIHKPGGESRVFIDGKKARERTIRGETRNWDGSFRLALANELSGGRPWLGTLRRVAIYDRAFKESEVAARFRAANPPRVARIQPEPKPQPEPAPKPEPKPGQLAPEADGGQRAGGQLLALYDFKDTEGDLIRDRSGQRPPLDLRIANANAVQRSAGLLEIRGPAGITSTQAPRRLAEAAGRTGALSVEAWVRPAKADQAGPARMVSFSNGSVERNFTLGQDGRKLNARLRATRTDKNGMPALGSKAELPQGKWTHVVFTRERGGRTRLYVDGRENAAGSAAGDLSNWDPNYRLTLGDEIGRERRTWLGGYRLVAIYGRSLSAGEVMANFRAGPSAGTVESAPHANKRLFENEITAIFSKHCLECHDSANRKGKLDLSKRDTALASKTIVPGKSAESELWLSVFEDEMPHKRDPLPAADKAALKQWIDAGAHWTTAELDPLAHKLDKRAGENWLRRLTIPEYIASVRTAVGVDVSKEARELLPPDLRADGFSNTAYNLGVDLQHVEAYTHLAEIAVERMDVEAFSKRFERNRRFEDKEMGALIEKMGGWILRGPLEDREIILYRGIASAVASSGGSIDEAVGLIIEAMLQSPRFLYRMEHQLGDGSAYPIGPHELASRLSYMIWGAPPDAELFKTAGDGFLLIPQEIDKQVARMLEDPRARQRSLEFAAQWLDLGRLENIRPAADRFPEWSPGLARDMRAETLAFFEDVAWKRKAPLHELFDANFTYATPRLAKHYRLVGLDIAALDAAAETEPVRIDLSKVPSRGGLLTQGSILTIGGDEASMVTRGLFVLHDVLGSGVNDPPPGTDTTPVPAEPGISQRRIAEQRITAKACGGCHEKFEPLAFGLEIFDGVGAYHRLDHHGNALRDDGAILFPGTAEATEYSNVAEMMELLAKSERVRLNLTRKLTQFAIGRPLVAADGAAVEAIHKKATAKGGTYQDLLSAIATSELVLMARTEDQK